MRYDIREFDTSEAANNQEIIVAAKGVAFLVVPTPLRVRINSPTAPAIAVHAPSTFESNETIKAIYVSHDGEFDTSATIMAYDCMNVSIGAQAMDEQGHAYVRLADRLSYDLDSVTVVASDALAVRTEAGSPIQSYGRSALVAKDAQAAAPVDSALQLDTLERTTLSAWCSLSGAGDVALDGSDDAATWYELERQTLAAAGAAEFNRSIGWRYVRLRVATGGLDVVRVISAKD